MASRGTQCCAFGCNKRRKRKKNDGQVIRSDSEGSEDEESARKRQFPRTFHSFPLDPEKRKLWVQNIRRVDWQPSRYSRICSDHFKEKFVDRTAVNVNLRANAVPTRFKLFPEHLKKEIKEREALLRVELGDDTHEALPQSSKDQACLAHKNKELPLSHIEIGDDTIDVLPQNSEDLTCSSDIEQNLFLSQVEVGDMLKALPQSSKDKRFSPSKKQAPGPDHLGYCLPPPAKLKYQLEKSQNRVFKLQRKIRTLQQQSRRLKTRVKSLKGLVKLLQKNSRISEHSKEHLNQPRFVTPRMIWFQKITVPTATNTSA